MSVYATDSRVEQDPLPLLPHAIKTACVQDVESDRAMTPVTLDKNVGPVYVERCIDYCFKHGYGKWTAITVCDVHDHRICVLTGLSSL